MFDALLAWLDTDRNAAGTAYHNIHAKLVRFFEWRGSPTPEEHADRTIDRVARRVAEGQGENIPRPWPYFHGVALNVMREYWKSTPPPEELPHDLPAPAERESDAGEELRMACYRECFLKLPAPSREILIAYHRGNGRERIDRRRDLAMNLGVDLNALRIRVFRLREQAFSCAAECIRRKGNP